MAPNEKSVRPRASQIPTSSDSITVNRLLRQWREGDESAYNDLITRLHRELLSENELARLLTINRTVEKMEELDPDMAHIADPRLVLGLALEETARELNLPINKVKREWLLIRRFLAQKY